MADKQMSKGTMGEAISGIVTPDRGTLGKFQSRWERYASMGIVPASSYGYASSIYTVPENYRLYIGFFQIGCAGSSLQYFYLQRNGADVYTGSFDTIITQVPNPSSTFVYEAGETVGIAVCNTDPTSGMEFYYVLIGILEQI